MKTEHYSSADLDYSSTIHFFYFLHSHTLLPINISQLDPLCKAILPAEASRKCNEFAEWMTT